MNVLLHCFIEAPTHSEIVQIKIAHKKKLLRPITLQGYVQYIHIVRNLLQLQVILRTMALHHNPKSSVASLQGCRVL